MAATGLIAAGGAQAAVPPDFFGVNAVRPNSGDYEAMASFGFGTIRVEASWRTVQFVEGGEFHWSKVDERFRGAAEAGLRPLPIVFGTPPWIGEEGTVIPPVRNQADRAAWQRFVATFYLRYGPGGAFWRNQPELDGSLARPELILWNEQNARAFWSPRADPGEYAALLRITREALKPRFPAARIVIGGMYGYPRHSKSMKMPTFLRRLYRKPGAKRASDGVALHPYASGVNGMRRQIERARRIMRGAGEGNTGVWITEIGWATAGEVSGAEEFLVKSEKKQARLLKQSYRVLLEGRDRWNIRAALWFTWRDTGGEAVCGWCPHAGLLRRDFSLKPAAGAYRELIDAQTGAGAASRPSP